MGALDPHQLRASDWAVGRGGVGLLHMDRGTGKTFTAVDVLRRLDARCVLVFTPAKVKGQWVDEIAKYDAEIAPVGRALVIEGDGQERAQRWITGGARFTIANYDLLCEDRDFALLQEVPWDAIVLDESHAVNNPTAIRSKRLKYLRPPIRLALSGDPFPNAIHECWNLMDWLEPGCLGRNFWSFRKRFCYTNPYIPSQIVGYRDEHLIRAAIERNSHRVTWADADLGIPDLKVTEVSVILGPAQREAYTAFLKDSLLELQGGTVEAKNVLERLLRLRQIVNDPEAVGLTVPSAKAEALAGHLEDGVKTIVFTEFSECAKRLARRFEGSALVHGGMTSVKSDAELRRFKRDPACRTLFSTSAGKYGLNLQEAKRVIHLDLPWNWAGVTQRTGRAQRRGQEDEVEEVYLLAERTVDIKMWRLVQKKRKSVDRFTTQELLEIMNDE